MKKIICLFFIFSFCSVEAQTCDLLNTADVISFAKKFLGTRYVYARNSPKDGFDCSGFTYYVFKNFNINVPRASIDYRNFGETISIDSARPGDIIVFWRPGQKIPRPGHVGIVTSGIGENLKFIHSSPDRHDKGVVITAFNSVPYYKKNFMRICRLKIPLIN
ncbi:MAG: C40 family peptidase [Bacteroidota bacterium]|jgi:cell wall-associated NlpC family hydrolase